jgi:hypothetical protein
VVTAITLRKLAMNDSAVIELGRSLLSAVETVDVECKRVFSGCEYGLCNVKRQLTEDIAAGLYSDAPTRRLTEEPATAWLLARGLPQHLAARSERPYPAASRKKCDLVITLASGDEFWVEVKFAWKTWCGYIDKSNCVRGFETNADFFYHGYLFGNHHSHSAAGDFVKLIQLAPASADLGLLLVGVDSTDSPMDKDIQSLERPAINVGWLREEPRRWKDRRDPAGRCRVNCWFWRHPPRA